MCKDTGRPKRKRRTPQEATADERRRLNADIARRQRQHADNMRVQRAAQQRLLDQPPVTDDVRSELDNIAYNLHYAYNWDGHGDQAVTAVVRMRATNRLVVFPQRFMTAMSDYAAQHYQDRQFDFRTGGGSHLHAEMYAVLAFLLLGQDPSEQIAEIGVSKEICPNCAAILDFLGITYNLAWVTGKGSKHWKHPWDLLPATCKPAVRDPRWDSDDDDQSGGGDAQPALIGTPAPIRV